MKKNWVLFLVAGVILAAIGFNVGKSIGENQAQKKFDNLSHTALEAKISKLEKSKQRDFLHLEAKIITEAGSFFSSDKHYLRGKISNSSLTLTYTKIVILIEYKSKLDKTISKQKVSINKKLYPNNSISYKNRLSIPDGLDNYVVKILEFY
jgi:hypothetical protein